MKKTDSPQLEALEALLAEKRKHEGYLAKLEERRAGTPEHVFTRLRDEYLTKVMDAQVRAHAEAESLESGLEVDQVAVAEVEARLAALDEERVEGDLRAAVGELDQKDWQKRLIALNASIAMAEKERDALTSSAERIRALLAEARGVPAMPAAIQEPVSAKPVPRASAAAITNAPNFDELAFLNSVVGRTSSPAMPMPVSPAPAPRSSMPVPAIKESPSVKDPASVKEPTSAPKPEPSSAPRAEPSSAPKPELASAPKPEPVSVSVSAPAPEPVAAPVSAPEPTAVPELALGETAVPAAPAPEPAPAASEEPSAPRAQETAAAVSAVAVAPAAPVSNAPVPAVAEPVDPEDEEPPSALGRATSRNSQAIKTLKCGECGSMNYPTEWYCERCGGELAAL